MGRIKTIIDAAKNVMQRFNKSKQASKATKPVEKPQQKAVKQDKQKQAEAKKQKEKEKVAADADKVRQDLEKKGGGSYPAEEVDGPDGGSPNTPAAGNNNNNNGGDYDPPREPPPRSSYRGKNKSKGRSI